MEDPFDNKIRFMITNPYLDEIKEIAKKTENSGNKLSKNKKVGRNEPCPCGSGNKFKRCCLK